RAGSVQDSRAGLAVQEQVDQPKEHRAPDLHHSEDHETDGAPAGGPGRQGLTKTVPARATRPSGGRATAPAGTRTDGIEAPPPAGGASFLTRLSVILYNPGVECPVGRLPQGAQSFRR